MERPIFLTAEWRYLAMLNFAVAPEVLRPYLPFGTELDFFHGRTFVSVVGFWFARTRVFGVPIPFHTDFEEVNLRFYVRRQTPAGWRRGVVFVRELVPRQAIALIARTLYGEPYSALPMRHRLAVTETGIEVEYAWRRAGTWECLHAAGRGRPSPIAAGSEEEFITEHYWGYTARGPGANEYQVDHPRWNIWPQAEITLEADVRSLYGDRFVATLAARPTSAFIAEGSPVAVRRKTSLRPATAAGKSLPETASRIPGDSFPSPGPTR